MLFSLLVLGLLLLNTLFFTCRNYPKITGSSLLIVSILSVYNMFDTNKNGQRTTEPNVIIIGIDSLSPNNINKKDTPTLAHFIQTSVFFRETISPLARTYPAWTTILTGLHPYHHQARYNLMPSDLVKNSLSLAWSLQSLGYQTIFATDDRRFNNMGKEFGFQKVIGPKVGVNDILLGTFNDSPLSNLLVNLPIGRWLFPYNHINRASYFSYYPQSFEKVLDNTLISNNQTSPTFMAVHFTLPHWPYAWAESSPIQARDEYSVDDKEFLYRAALQRTDRQVEHFLQMLRKYGYLENSLIIVLSDHGEALYVPGSRQTSLKTYQGQGVSIFADYLKRKTSTELEMSAGHGSDLLSKDQYHCLLTFKIYKNNQLKTTSKIINTRVALTDITPTIQSFTGLPTRQSTDGVSLLHIITNDNKPLPERTFIMESGMLPNQFLSRERARVLGQKFFTINPQTDQLQLRKKALSTLDALKLYAVIKGDWIVALYPDDNGYIPVTLNLKNGKWTDDFNADFVKKSPAINMLSYLQQFYKRKLSLIGNKTMEHINAKSKIVANYR